VNEQLDRDGDSERQNGAKHPFHELQLGFQNMDIGLPADYVIVPLGERARCPERLLSMDRNASKTSLCIVAITCLLRAPGPSLRLSPI